MSVDWRRIRTEYVKGGISYQNLADKYCVSYSTLTKRAAAEKWKASKDEQTQVIRSETDRKTAEKIAENESDIAAAMSRIRLKLTQRIEKAVNTTEEIDTTELRKLVQCFKDMSEAQNGADEEKQGALNDILSAVKGVGDDQI